MVSKSKIITLLILFAFPLIGLCENHIIINKENFTLYLLEDADTIASYPVCLGENLGQKTRTGDHKTPEGTFKITQIQNSSSWNHTDKHGVFHKGAYGPWFFRLSTPMSKHIGIHGTDQPESVGTRASEGCIRLRNEDLRKLKPYVFKGMKVVITPDRK